MSEMALQLKRRVQNVNIMNNNIEVKKLILNTMFFIIGGLALLYVLILGNMVFNIVQRRSLEKEALTLTNEVSDLELSYLSVSGSVDIALGNSLGFKEIKPNFATAIHKSIGSIKLTGNEI